MGTVASIAVDPRPGGEEAASAAVAAACRELHRVDERYSTWSADSLLSRFRRGEATPDEELAGVLEHCRELRELTGGWFDPWAARGGVDPTGMVKGWAAQRACAILAAADVASGSVNAGGDVATTGAPPDGWRWGLRHPWRPDALAGVVALPPGGAVATSGTYERGQHLWNPFDGGPARAKSATVCGPSLTVADALATALAVAGAPLLDRIEALDSYEAWVVSPEGDEASTSGFPWA